MRSGDHIGALRLLKQALDVPENLIDTRLRLGLLYRKLQRSPHGEEDLKTAIRLLPGETMAAYRLGELYLRQGRTQEAYRMFTACIRREPSLMLAYIGLSQALLKMGDYEGSVEVFRKAMRSYPYDDRFYGCMAIHYLRLKDHARADEYFRAAKAFQLDYLNPITCRNYSLTLAELKKRNIPAVCMQYPLRSIEPLKRMVPDTGDVIFVDNESNFREALKTHPFEYYFRDQFGGDFGHCTWKGNELIAENLARRILEELPARGHPH